jgi:hypothetical protein
VPALRGFGLGRETARGGIDVLSQARAGELDREVAIRVILPLRDEAEFGRESGSPPG